MLLGSVQISGETLSKADVKDICGTLESHQIRLLSLRECQVNDKDFKRLMKSISHCKSILQLNLNLGLINDRLRVELVAQALHRNRSLTGLFMHGNKLGDEGMAVICKALNQHPNITVLDVGDCHLGDASIDHICDLLPPDGAKSGLVDLALSANPLITAKGWARLCIGIAASSMLRALYLDYNGLGDYGAGCLVVAAASSRRLEILDLEGTGMTEHGAQLFLHLLESYPIRLRKLILNDNKVKQSTVEAIKTCLIDDDDAVSDTSEQSVLSPREKYQPTNSLEHSSATKVKVRPIHMSQSASDAEIEEMRRREMLNITNEIKNETKTTFEYDELQEVPVQQPPSAHTDWVSFLKPQPP